MVIVVASRVGSRISSGRARPGRQGRCTARSPATRPRRQARAPARPWRSAARPRPRTGPRALRASREVRIPVSTSPVPAVARRGIAGGGHQTAIRPWGSATTVGEPLEEHDRVARRAARARTTANRSAAPASPPRGGPSRRRGGSGRRGRALRRAGRAWGTVREPSTSSARALSPSPSTTSGADSSARARRARTAPVAAHRGRDRPQGSDAVDLVEHIGGRPPLLGEVDAHHLGVGGGAGRVAVQAGRREPHVAGPGPLGAGQPGGRRRSSPASRPRSRRRPATCGRRGVGPGSRRRQLLTSSSRS